MNDAPNIEDILDPEETVKAPQLEKPRLSLPILTETAMMLSATLEGLDREVDANNGVMTPEVEEAYQKAYDDFDNAIGSIDDKLEAYGFVMEDMMESAAADTAAAQSRLARVNALKARAARKKAHVERLKMMARVSLEMTGRYKAETTNFNFALTRSSAKPEVLIDRSQLSESYYSLQIDEGKVAEFEALVRGSLKAKLEERTENLNKKAMGEDAYAKAYDEIERELMDEWSIGNVKITPAPRSLRVT